MLFEQNVKAIYEGGWNESRFTIECIILETKFERCKHISCLGIHELYTARTIAGGYVVGYPEQFTKVNG